MACNVGSIVFFTRMNMGSSNALRSRARELLIEGWLRLRRSLAFETLRVSSKASKMTRRLRSSSCKFMTARVPSLGDDALW